jgi:hypothetical protein
MLHRRAGGALGPLSRDHELREKKQVSGRKESLGRRAPQGVREARGAGGGVRGGCGKRSQMG